MSDLTAAREFCSAILPRVSRTFALSIAMLPEALRETVCTAYLLCRIADTIEDDDQIDPETREGLFDHFDASDASAFEQASLARSLGGAGTPSHELCVHAEAVFLVFRALPAAHRDVCWPSVLEMARGMREFRRRADADGGRLRLCDLADLERYCYFVAGTVGELLTGLFELSVPSMPLHARDEARARAISFGLGLQMVNIVKDVTEDLARGDCFLPTDLLAANGLDAKDLTAPEHRDAGLVVVRAVCKRAREHLERAREYTLLWPIAGGSEVRFFCAVPLALALATLHEVETGRDALVPDRKPKVTRETVTRIFQEAEGAIADDEALTAMLDRFGAQ